MGLFSRQLPDSQKEGILALVRHLQELLAYQQLAMEIYNDALAAVVEIRQKVPRFGRVTKGIFNDPTLVSKLRHPCIRKEDSKTPTDGEETPVGEHIGTCETSIAIPRNDISYPRNDR